MKTTFADNNFNDLFDVVNNIDDAAKPSDKQRKKDAVDGFIEDGVELAARYDKFKTETLVRGNKALYEQLTSIYAFALRVDDSPLKERIVDRIREELKERHAIKTTQKTPFMTLIVKYIVKSDRQTAFNYGRCLRVAYEEDVAVKGLAEFIEQNGGVQKITKTQAERSQQAAQKGNREQLTELFREWMVLRSQDSVNIIDGEIPVIKWRADAKQADKKEGAQHTGEFAIFITRYDEARDAYAIIDGHDFGRNFEDTIIRHMLKRLPNVNADAVRKTIDKLKRGQPLVTVGQSTATAQPKALAVKS